ncbi:unnamed protein product [Amoebophrya sp. A25]|nr:unnamed protein product [Amoebophrya sp. A25]|eukprot:GSA25T00013962001.1
MKMRSRCVRHSDNEVNKELSWSSFSPRTREDEVVRRHFPDGADVDAPHHGGGAADCPSGVFLFVKDALSPRSESEKSDSASRTTQNASTGLQKKKKQQTAVQEWTQGGQITAAAADESRSGAFVFASLLRQDSETELR